MIGCNTESRDILRVFITDKVATLYPFPGFLFFISSSFVLIYCGLEVGVLVFGSLTAFLGFGYLVDEVWGLLCWTFWVVIGLGLFI